LALHRATVSFLNASLALDAEARARAEEISHPTLVMLAGRDQIVDNEATRRYLDRLGTSRLEVKEYPEARHTLEFEPNREAIFSDLIDWLNSLPRQE
jgi:acylglycerol lipase